MSTETWVKVLGLVASPVHGCDADVSAVAVSVVVVRSEAPSLGLTPLGATGTPIRPSALLSRAEAAAMLAAIGRAAPCACSACAALPVLIRRALGVMDGREVVFS